LKGLLFEEIWSKMMSLLESRKHQTPRNLKRTYPWEMIAWWKQWSRRKDTRVFLHANVIEASSRLNAAREYFQLPQASETNLFCWLRGGWGDSKAVRD